MSDTPSPFGEVFDVEKLRSLVDLMKEYDLSEVDLKQEGRRIRLRRGGDPPPAPVFAPAPVVAAPVPTSAAAGQAAADEAHIAYIRSPMVGTFYAKPNPEAEPYVKVGDHVSEDSIVCQIEAMKMFTEIQAEVSGAVVAVLVKNEESVDVNKPLFKIDTSK